MKGHRFSCFTAYCFSFMIHLPDFSISAVFVMTKQ